jgi:hypothetical protein
MRQDVPAHLCLSLCMRAASWANMCKSSSLDVISGFRRFTATRTLEHSGPGWYLGEGESERVKKWVVAAGESEAVGVV